MNQVAGNYVSSFGHNGATEIKANTKFRFIGDRGHTDSVGDRNYNIELSGRRAKSVQEFLSSRYNIGDKSEAKGFGSDNPVADNGNYQGRRQNRRVEIKVWRKQ